MKSNKQMLVADEPSGLSVANTSDSRLMQQLTDIQITVAYLEDTIERLDSVVAAQDKQIQDIQRQLKLLYGQLTHKEEATIAPFDIVADRPPHY